MTDVLLDKLGKPIYTNFRQDYDWEQVIDPITDKQAADWIKALRSGQYNQAKNQLGQIDKDGDICGYCCLGVYAEEHRLFDTLYISFDDVILTTVYGNDILAPYVLPEDLQNYLASLNDIANLTFDQIADYLEYGFAVPNKETND